MSYVPERSSLPRRLVGQRFSKTLHSPYRREALVSSVTSLILYLLGIATGPILARVLGPDGRGELAAVLMPMLFVSWMLSFGMPMSAAYHVDIIPEGKLLRMASLFGIVVGAPVCTVLWFLAPQYLDGYSATTITWIRVFLVFMPLSVGIQTALEIRRRRGADGAWNRWRSAPILVPAIAVLLLALTGTLSLGTALAANLAGHLVPLAFFGLRMRRSRGERSSIAVFRLTLPYAWRNALTVGAGSITNRFDQVILAAVVQPEELGYYAVAISASALSGPLTSGLTLAIFGSLRNETSADRARARLLRSLYATLAVSVSIALTIGLLAPTLMRLVFGPGFEPAAVPLRLLLPGQVAMDVLLLLISKFYADGRPGEATRAAILGAAVTLTGLAILVPSHGINGAAATTSIAMVVQVIYLVRRGALQSPATEGHGDSGSEGQSPTRAAST